MRVRAAVPPVAFPTPRDVSLALTRTLACTLACGALAGSIAPIRAQGAAAAAPHAIAIDRLARIDSALDRAARDERVAGAVLLVLRDGRVAYERAVGWADREARTRMTPLSIFRIASQSKAITSTAVMMLIEEGKLGLGDPVSRYLPTFARSRVAIKSDTGRALVPATRAITIRDLLTHTAGISYGTDSLVAPLYAAQGLGPAAGWGWYTADKDEPVCTTMDRLGTLPFVAQPGSAFVYGYNTDILGCVVERVSGMPLDEFTRTRITAPLGMKDTWFYVPPEKRNMMTAVYMSDSTGRAARAPDGSRGQGHYADGPRKSFAGGAGLLSTARDYARFLEMIRNDGTLDGRHYLSPRSVALMRTNQSGTLYRPDGSSGFGFAFETTERLGASGYRSVGSFGWGGAYGSTYWVDPSEHMVVVWMVQLLPNRADIGGRIGQLVYQALVPASH